MTPTTSRRLAERIERAENMAARASRTPSKKTEKAVKMTAAPVYPVPETNDKYARTAWRAHRSALLEAWRFASIHALPDADALWASMAAADAVCVALGLPTVFDETGLAVRS